MDIRKVPTTEYDEVKALVLEVFMEFEAPDYGHEGVETFKRTGIEDEKYMESLTVYGAYIDNQLVGVIATRNEDAHIALFFVKGQYHCQGIGTDLFEMIKREDMTVNSSPYAEKVYERLGFVRTSGEEIFDGVRFIPMGYCLNKK